MGKKSNKINNGLVISVEMIHLLKWIIENAEPEINNLIGKALDSGAMLDFVSDRSDTERSAEELQNVILSLIVFFENQIKRYTSIASSCTSFSNVDSFFTCLENSSIDPILILFSIRQAIFDLKRQQDQFGFEPTQLDQEVLKQEIFKNVLTSLDNFYIYANA